VSGPPPPASSHTGAVARFPRLRLPAWCLGLLPIIGGLIGLAAALAMPWPHGPGHSCPANGPACFYPANLGGQRLLWTAVGLLVGLLLAAVAAAAAARRQPKDPVRR
jgi:hypothetical protein